MLWWTSWSTHAVDKLLAPKCGGDAMLLRVVSSRVVLLGAPSRLCLPPSSAEQLWPTAASSCRRARTTNSPPGRGAGRLVALRRDDWHLSRSCPATGPCHSPPLTCPCAQLASRTARHCSPVCACATQGSEPLLCAQQARRGSSAAVPTGICVAFTGGAAGHRQV